MTGLNELASDAVSLDFDFSDDQRLNLVRALEAPVCEFVGIRLSPKCPPHLA
jgi:hypothetical protein